MVAVLIQFFKMAGILLGVLGGLSLVAALGSTMALLLINWVFS